MVVSLKSGSFTANSGSWTPARYCYGISTSKTVARSWMTALSASKASSMPPAESYVVSSTPPESIDFTHRFPRRSKIIKVANANKTLVAKPTNLALVFVVIHGVRYLTDMRLRYYGHSSRVRAGFSSLERSSYMIVLTADNTLSLPFFATIFRIGLAENV